MSTPESSSIHHNTFQDIAQAFNRRVFTVPYYHKHDQNQFGSSIQNRLIGWVVIFFYLDQEKLKMILTDFKTIFCSHMFTADSKTLYGSLHITPTRFLSLIFPTFITDQKHLIHYSHLDDVDVHRAFPQLSSLAHSIHSTLHASQALNENSKLGSLHSHTTSSSSSSSSSSLHQPSQHLSIRPPRPLDNGRRPTTQPSCSSSDSPSHCIIPTNLSQLGNAYTHAHIDGPLIQAVFHPSTGTYTLSVSYSLDAFDICTDIPLHDTPFRSLSREYLADLTLLMITSITLVHQHDLLLNLINTMPPKATNHALDVASETIQSHLVHNNANPSSPDSGGSGEAKHTMSKSHVNQLLVLSNQLESAQQQCQQLDQSNAQKDKEILKQCSEIDRLKKEVAQYRAMLSSILCRPPSSHTTTWLQLPESLSDLHSMTEMYLERVKTAEHVYNHSQTDQANSNNSDPEPTAIDPTTPHLSPCKVVHRRQPTRRIYGQSNISKRLRVRQSYDEDDEDD